MKNQNVYFVIFILLLHFCFINGLEKMLFHSYVDSPQVRRPNNECETIHNPAVECLGMPSGHVEITTLLGCFLYSSNILSFPILIGVIVAMALQRILTHRHTVLQTIVGFLFGLFYAFAYLSIQVSYQQVLLCVFFLFLYCNLLVLFLENQLAEKVPDWVDKNMLAAIKKKKAHYSYKIFWVLFSCLRQQNILYFSWRDTEYYLNEMLDNIRRSGIKFDAVVGIKTGGAILSDYISNQLHLPNYKIKVSRKKYQCNKQPHDFLQNNIEVYHYRNDKEYMMCEEIQEDITGKKVILIDELVASGNSMNVSIDYLIRKEVNYVYPVAIYSQRQTKMHPTYPLNVLFTPKNTNTVWPWGYDN